MGINLFALFGIGFIWGLIAFFIARSILIGKVVRVNLQAFYQAVIGFIFFPASFVCLLYLYFKYRNREILS